MSAMKVVRTAAPGVIEVAVTLLTCGNGANGED